MTRDELVAADIHRLRGRAEMLQGAPMSAHALLVVEARRIESDRTQSARRRCVVEAAGACLMTWTLDEAERTARLAGTAAERAGGEVALAAAAMLGHALVLRRESGAAELLARAAPLVEGESAIRLAHVVPSLVLPLIWLEQYERAASYLTRAVDEARALSAPSRALPQLLGFRSGLDFRMGRWASAYADAGESARLAIETGQVSESAHGLVCLIRVEAAMGRDVECAGHAEQALDLADRFGIDSVRLHTQSALARLDLARGRLDDAVARLRDVAVAMDDHGVREPSVLLYEPDLIEALARSGRGAAAAEAFERFTDRATLAGTVATAARCAGIIRGDPDDFERAIEAHERVPQPFERARTELAYGEHLRRARRIADARPRLATALDVFTRLGAEPWAERARAELQASGGTAPSPRARSPSSPRRSCRSHSRSPRERPTARPAPHSSSATRRLRPTSVAPIVSSACRGRAPRARPGLRVPGGPHRRGDRWAPSVTASTRSIENRRSTFVPGTTKLHSGPAGPAGPAGIVARGCLALPFRQPGGVFDSADADGLDDLLAALHSDEGFGLSSR